MLIGLDIGTTHVKAGLVSPEGRLLDVARAPTPLASPHPGWAEHPPHELWGLCVELIQTVLARSGGSDRDLLGIGIAGMAEAGLLMSEAGDELTPILAWHDRRAEKIASEWTHSDAAEHVWNTTGLRPSFKTPVVKLQWLQRHRTDIMARAYKWLHAPDYVAFRLTGHYATSPSLATRTMAFDLERGEWSDSILDRAGIHAGLLPRVVSSTQPMGQIGGEASEALGVAPGTPVVVAGHDHPCGAVAAGVLAEGDVLDSLGTAETLLRPATYSSVRDRSAVAYDYGRHVDGGLYVLGAFSMSGGTLEWWVRTLYGQSDEPVTARKYEAAAADAEKAAGRPSGLLHMPYLHGNGPPNKDPNATGGMFGLTRDVSRGDMMLAVLEGLACESRRILDGMGLARPERITAIGGGTRNPAWVQVKADVMGACIEIPTAPEAALQGAAMAAGVAVGVFDDLEQASAATARPSATIEPRTGLVEQYDDWFQSVYLPSVSTTAAFDTSRRAWRDRNGAS